MRNTISANDTYTVYVGGTSTSKTNVATISASAVKYDVKFVNWDGSEISSASLEEGAKITPPETNPTKASDDEYDYTFAGWYVSTDESQAVVTFDDNTKVKGAVTYVAKFTPVPKTQGGETTQYDFNVNSGLKGTYATKPYKIENGKIIRVKGLKATDVVTVTVDGTAYTAKYYETPDHEIVHIVALVTEKTITSDMISHTTGTPTLIKFGDVDGKNGVTAVDITYFRRSNAGYTLNGTKMSLPTEIENLILWDVDGNGMVNAVDITAFRRAKAGYTLNGVKLSLDTMGAYTIK